MVPQAVCVIYQCPMFFLNLVDQDKEEWGYTNRLWLFTFIMQPISQILDCEVAVTWIDLYDRTNKMSKSTSPKIKLLRYGLRILAIILSVGVCIWIVMSMFSASGYIALFMGAMVAPAVGGVVVAVGGHLITKSLCPDRKDVANPNWKVAEAIRRGVKHCVGSHFCAMLLLFAANVSLFRSLLNIFTSMIFSNSASFLFYTTDRPP